MKRRGNAVFRSIVVPFSYCQAGRLELHIYHLCVFLCTGKMCFSHAFHSHRPWLEQVALLNISSYFSCPHILQLQFATTFLYFSDSLSSEVLPMSFLCWSDVSRILWNAIVRCIDKYPPLIPVLSQLNPFHPILGLKRMVFLFLPGFVDWEIEGLSFICIFNGPHFCRYYFPVALCNCTTLMCSNQTWALSFSKESLDLALLY